MRALYRLLLLSAVAYTVLTTIAFAQTPKERTVDGKAAHEPLQSTAAQPPAVVTRPRIPLDALRTAKLIYVYSESLVVGQSVIETKLRKRPEFQQLGLMITRDPKAADLILEVRHDVLTKCVYTAVDPHTNIVVASGKLSSLGGTVAGKVAERFMKQMVRARQQGTS